MEWTVYSDSGLPLGAEKMMTVWNDKMYSNQHAGTEMKPRGQLTPNTIPGETSNAAGFS